MRKKRRAAGRGLLIAPILFFALAFLLLAVREGDWRFYSLAAIWPLFLLLSGLLFPSLLGMDRVLLTAVHVPVGFLLLLTALFLPDSLLRLLITLAAGELIMLLSLAFSSSARESAVLSGAMGAAALVALLLPLAADLPVHTGFCACVLLLFPFCALLKARRFLWAALPALAGLALLLASGDWAGALFWALTASLLFWMASGSWLVLGISLLSGAACVTGGLLLMPALSDLPRLSQAEMVSAFSGGLFGTGPGLGSTLSAADPSPLWPLLLTSEQFGSFSLCCLIALFSLLLIRSVAGAIAARRQLSALRSMGGALLLFFRALTALAGCLGWLPVSAAGFPFLSADPLTLIADFFLAGLFAGLWVENARDLEEDAHLAMLAH